LGTRRCGDGSFLAMLTSRQAKRMRAIASRCARQQRRKQLEAILTPSKDRDQPYEVEVHSLEGHEDDTSSSRSSETVDVTFTSTSSRHIEWTGPTYYSRGYAND